MTLPQFGQPIARIPAETDIPPSSLEPGDPRQVLQTNTGGDAAEWTDSIQLPGRVGSTTGLEMLANTPAALIANQDDWNVDASFIRASTDATRNLTGLANGRDGKIVIIANVGANNLVLQHQNAGSVAANRFLMVEGEDITLQPDDEALLIYDPTTARWRVKSLAVSADFQRFTSSGIWTKPSRVKTVIVEIVGASGGGAGGEGRGAGANRVSGGGGGAGPTIRRVFDADDLGATEVVTIGAGGAAGVGAVNSDGSDGAVGGTTSVGTLLSLFGGGGGEGGNGVLSFGGGGGGQVGAGGSGASGARGAPVHASLAAPDNIGGGGGAGLDGESGGDAELGGGGGGGGARAGEPGDGGGSVHSGGGGAGGGGVDSGTNTHRAGHDGGLQGAYTPGGGAAGGAVGGGNGVDGVASTTFAGGGGGGGGGNDSGTGGDGGAGGAPGGGGGGGGGGTNTGGDGGAGSRGEVRVWSA